MRSARFLQPFLLVFLSLPASAKKDCTVESLEAFQPGKGTVVSVKRATLQGTLDPEGFMIYECEKAEQDWQCLKRVSEALVAQGTEVKAELAGKVLSYVVVFVIDGQRMQGEFATRGEIMKNLEYHQKTHPDAVIETVTEKMDPDDRHVAAQFNDKNAVKDDATAKVWMVWNPQDPDLFASLGVLEDAARMKGLALAPGKWRSDGFYEFELSCP
jgi:hypothetical protein